MKKRIAKKIKKIFKVGKTLNILDLASLLIISC